MILAMASLGFLTGAAYWAMALTVARFILGDE